jgi:hypothetical protein
MRLDAVLADPKLRWLATELEKVAYVGKVVPTFPTERLPHVAVGVGARRRLRLFPDGVLVGVSEAQELTFVYVVTSPSEEDWRRAVTRYGELLGALPRWRFRAFFPPELTPGMSRFHIMFRNELAEPLSPSTIRDLRWHFEQLRGRIPRAAREEERFQDGQVQLVVTPRFRVLHQRWLADGDAAVDVASSRAIVEHLGNHTGQVNCVRLPVSYRHVTPLVSRDRIPREGVEEGVEQGEQTSAHPQPPIAGYDPSDPSGCARDWQRLVDAQKALLSQ